jgi:endoglucanase
VANDTPLLHLSGNHIVDGQGNPVVLRGFGLGGWMNMENFITGYPANEEAQREAVRATLGEEKYQSFFDRFLEHFFTEGDARFIRSLGLNLLRLPVNYRHFEDDERPFEIKEEGFRHLDRVVELCAAQGIYTIIDLHALPGYQNQHWHSDNPTHKALLWRHKHFQDRTVNLWEHIAARYKGNPWVAGYNPINEPADPTEELLMPFYRRLYEAIRAVDPEHLIFLEGNRYSVDFHMFGEPWEDVVYTNHDYALPGFVDGGPYPGTSRGEYVDKQVLEETFLKRSEYMLQHDVPVWVGEFGPVYAGRPRLARHAARATVGPARDLRPSRRQLGYLDLQGHRTAGGRLHRTGLSLGRANKAHHREKGEARDRRLGRHGRQDQARHGAAGETLRRGIPASRPFPIRDPAGNRAARAQHPACRADAEGVR